MYYGFPIRRYSCRLRFGSVCHFFPENSLSANWWRRCESKSLAVTVTLRSTKSPSSVSVCFSKIVSEFFPFSRLPKLINSPQVSLTFSLHFTTNTAIISEFSPERWPPSPVNFIISNVACIWVGRRSNLGQAAKKRTVRVTVWLRRT